MSPPRWFDNLQAEIADDLEMGLGAAGITADVEAWMSAHGCHPEQVAVLEDRRSALAHEANELSERVGVLEARAGQLAELVRIIAQDCGRDDAPCCAAGYHTTPAALREPWRGLLADVLSEAGVFEPTRVDISNPTPGSESINAEPTPQQDAEERDG